MERLDYKILEMLKGKFTEQSWKLMENMLHVWNDENGIYICHPNHIFMDKPINENSRDLIEVNWDAIDIERMLQVGDVKYFFDPFTMKPQFTYVHNRMKHEMKKLIQLKREAEAIRHLVVLQKCLKDHHFVRGIIRGDIKGYSLAFNPQYIHTIPTSVFDRSLRISGEDDSQYSFAKR